MSQKRTLQQLTFKDNFMFAATMSEPENCRMVLERILERPIERVEISKEKSLIFNPEYHGVRLDVYAKDEKNTHYDVEMQVATKKVLKRIRYYHGQMDMELIGTGMDYEELPESYVIFICDFDPLGLGKYRYTLKQSLWEAPDYAYEDGVHTILLNTKGANEEEVPRELVRFLHFVGARLEESTNDFGDSLVEQLQKTVREVKQSRVMGGRYMQLEELLKDEYSAGKAEGMAEGKAAGKVESVLFLLDSCGQVPEELKQKIQSVTDETCLRKLLMTAAKAETIEAFLEKAEEIW